MAFIRFVFVMIVLGLCEPCLFGADKTGFPIKTGRQKWEYKMTMVYRESGKTRGFLFLPGEEYEVTGDTIVQTIDMRYEGDADLQKFWFEEPGRKEGDLFRNFYEQDRYGLSWTLATHYRRFGTSDSQVYRPAVSLMKYPITDNKNLFWVYTFDNDENASLMRANAYRWEEISVPSGKYLTWEMVYRFEKNGLVRVEEHRWFAEEYGWVKYQRYLYLTPEEAGTMRLTKERYLYAQLEYFKMQLETTYELVRVVEL